MSSSKGEKKERIMEKCIHEDRTEPCKDIGCEFHDIIDCKKNILGNMFGQYLPEYNNYFLCNYRPNLNRGIIIAKEEKAMDLLFKGKGENGSKIRFLFPDEKNMKLAVSVLDLEFIKKIAIEYLKNNFNKINYKEFRFFLRTCEKLKKIKEKEMKDGNER